MRVIARFRCLFVSAALFAASACATLGDHPSRLEAEDAFDRQDWAEACVLTNRWYAAVEKPMNERQIDYLKERFTECGDHLVRERHARIERTADAGNLEDALVLGRCLNAWLDQPSTPTYVRAAPAVQAARTWIKTLQRRWAEAQVASLRARLAQGGDGAMAAAREVEALLAWSGAADELAAGFEPLLPELIRVRVAAIGETESWSLQESARSQVGAIRAIERPFGGRDARMRMLEDALGALDLTRGASGNPLRLAALSDVASSFPSDSPLRARLEAFLSPEHTAFLERARQLSARGLSGLAFVQGRLAAAAGNAAAANAYRKEAVRETQFHWTVERGVDRCPEVLESRYERDASLGGGGAEAQMTVTVDRCDLNVEKTGSYTSTAVQVRGAFSARLQMTGPWGTRTRELSSKPIRSATARSSDPDEATAVEARMRALVLLDFSKELEREIEKSARAVQAQFAGSAALANQDQEHLADMAVQKWVLNNGVISDAEWSALLGWLKLDRLHTMMVLQGALDGGVKATEAAAPAWANAPCPADFSLPEFSVQAGASPSAASTPPDWYKRPEPDTFEGYGGFSVAYAQPQLTGAERSHSIMLSAGGVGMPGLSSEDENYVWEFEGLFALGANADGRVSADCQAGMGAGIKAGPFVLVPAVVLGFDRVATSGDKYIPFALYAGLSGRLMARLTNRVTLEASGQIIARNDPTSVELTNDELASGSERRLGARLILRGMPARMFWLGAQWADYGVAKSLGGELGVFF